MTRKLPRKMLLLCWMVLGMLQMQAQGWEKKYSPDGYMSVNAVYTTPGGNYLTASFLAPPERVMKMDKNGEVLWQIDYDSLVVNSVVNITPDGGLVMAAIGVRDSQGHDTRAMIRIDSAGNKLWQKTVYNYNTASANGSGNADIDTTDNGGFVYTFTAADSMWGSANLYVERLDGNGNVLWKKTYLDTDTSPIAYSIRNSKDGGFIVTTAVNSVSSMFAFKIDGNGNLLWQYVPSQQTSLSTNIDQDGNILLLSSPFPSGSNSIIKLDQNGNVLRTQAYPALPNGDEWFGQLIARGNHTFSVLGVRTITNPITHVNSHSLSFSIIDTLGNILLFKEIPEANLGNVTLLQAGYKASARTNDGGFICGGEVLNDPQNYSGFLIKTDSNGTVYPATLSGTIFYDNNNNCIKDTSEIYLTPTYITFANATDTFTVITADSGYYSLGLDTGTYTIQVSPPSPYWRASDCDAATVRLPAGADSSVSLGLTPIVYSPYIAINGHISRQRICNQATYTAQYTNTGTSTFTGIIEIDVDTLLQVNSASPTWISQIGNRYTFLVDPLNVMQSANILVNCTVPCDADLTGRTTCINAQAFQDTIITASPLWDHSNLDMSVDYNPANDTITFTLKNAGTGTMGSPKSLIVIEDNVILLSIPQQLTAGLQYKQQVRANGATWRATITQTDYNPYSKFATAAIEGAGINAQGGISTGYFTQFPYNGYTSYQYNTCAEVFNSIDPNQKSVSPKGAGVNQLVDSNTTLEYTIDFQNTGNDTAYVVRVTDTLAPYLDPATIRLEVSSNPCQMQLTKNVVTFTFTHINLPDSGANQAGSNGFVKFGIHQKTGNTDGTVINNKAGIYFDYNQPVITNTATVRIGQLIVSGIQNVYEAKQVQINAYPNPFTNTTVIQVDGETFNDLLLNVYDVTGKLVKQQHTQNANQFILDRTGLSDGNYIFDITGNGKPVGNGKIIAQ